jgi:hypothetical protein
MERGHPVRQRAKPALLSMRETLSQGLFALRAQADRMSALRHSPERMIFRLKEQNHPKG